MTNETDTIEPPVAIMMQLANGPTLTRFCHAAAAELNVEIEPNDLAILAAYDEGLEEGEFAGEVCEDLTSQLFSAGYYVWWDAGDVVVWDLRGLDEDERDRFYRQWEDA